MLAIKEYEDESPPEKKPRILLCEVCNKEESKYKCPRCFYRTCSVQCSKQHKKDLQCNGERDAKSFSVVRRLADCNAATIADDEKFLNDIEKCVEKVLTKTVAQETGNNQESSHGLHNNKMNDDDTKTVAPSTVENIIEAEPGSSTGQQTTNDQNNDAQKHCNKVLTVKQRYLLNNALRRRIWLTIPNDEEEDGSRHEQFSDTIFWTIDLIFRRQVDEQPDNFQEYSYCVNSIPESICVSTLVRQFIKPKKIGPVVNRDDLDEVKLRPFQEVGMDGLTTYMPVPLENKERYYVIDMNKTILDNLRNRYVTRHPTFIITLDTQMGHYVTLSEQEAQEMAETRKARDAEERRKRPGFRGNKFGNRQGFNKRNMNFGRFQIQNRCRDDDISEKNIASEKWKYEANPTNSDRAFESNGRHGPKNNHCDELFSGFRDRRSDGFGKADFRRNWRFSGRRVGSRGRERNRMHPLEMSPAQLAAVDASQSLRRRDTSVSSDEAAMLAWAKAVDNRVKQTNVEEISHSNVNSVTAAET